MKNFKGAKSLRSLVLTFISMYAVLVPLLRSHPAVASTRRVEAPTQALLKPIRTLPNLVRISVLLAGGLGNSFLPNDPEITTRRSLLDTENTDVGTPRTPGGLDAYDVFYSDADGTLNQDGSYLTVEAVNNSQTAGGGGGRVAEIELFVSDRDVEFGNVVSSFVALGNNADPASVNNAIDGNFTTSSRLGNTVGQSQRLRITIGFLSTSGPPDTSIHTLSIEDAEVGEGNSGTVNALFKVRLSSPTSVPVTVDYSTEDFTAAASKDYVAESGTLTFPANSTDTLRTITVPVLGDTLYEAAEQFHVNLTNPVNAGIVRGQATGTIIDDDESSFTVCATDLPPPASASGSSTINVARNQMIDDVEVGLFLNTDSDPAALQHLDIFLKGPITDRGKLLVSEDDKTLTGEKLGTTCSPPDFIISNDSARKVYKSSPPYVGLFGPDPGQGGAAILDFSERETARGDWTLSFSFDDPFLVRLATLHCWCLRFNLPREGCRLQPATSQVPIGEFARLRARLTSNGAPVPNTMVSLEVRGPHNEIRLTDQAATDFNGQIDFSYRDFLPGTSNVEARAVVDGVLSIAKAQVTWVADGLAGISLCPMLLTNSGTPHGEANIAAARSFRDNVLAQSDRGRAYTEAYYRHSSEAVRLLMLNPMLMLRSREMLQRYRSAIDALAKGEPLTLSSGDIDEIDSFLSSFASKGSPELQKALRGVCKDLRDPRVHSEFHITVVEGRRRETSSLSPARSVTGNHNLPGFGALGLTTGMSVLVALFSGARARRRRAQARRFFCVALIFLVTSPVTGVTLNRRITRTKPEIPVGSKRRARPVEVSRRASSFGFVSGIDVGEPTVKYSSKDRRLSLNPHELKLDLKNSDNETLIQPSRGESTEAKWSERVSMTLLDANPSSTMRGLDPLSDRSNYFIGKDSSRWHAAVPAYSRVLCESVYPGVDVAYYGRQQQLEYDFIVAPGADPGAIKMRFNRAVTIDQNGDLLLSPSGDVRQPRPRAYQEINGVSQTVASRYSLSETNVVGFELGDYDKKKPLIIDPIIAYSTYLGGAGDDEGTTIATDSSGNAYVVGFTESTDLIGSRDSQSSFAGGAQDAFVAKVDPSGRLLYTTYLGGSGQDNAGGIALDSAGNVYVTGFTSSADFPLLSPLQPIKKGPFSAFISKLDKDGKLIYSTYLGGSAEDFGSSIAVDSSGNIYAAGATTSPDFPAANSVQLSLAGNSDAFVAKLNAKGDQLIYATYLGGSDHDGASSIAVDSAGAVSVTGVTASKNFPTVAAFQQSHGGGALDGFVARLNSRGDRLNYSTYLGGDGEDRAMRIALDATGNSYVAGDTDSSAFPTLGALQGMKAASSDAFLTKLNPTGSLLFSTYLGGNGTDGATGLSIDPSGRIFLTGFTSSTDFRTLNPVQAGLVNDSFDAFVAILNPSGPTLEFSTYLGGKGDDSGFGVAIGPSGDALVLGLTNSGDFPTINGFQSNNGGGTADLFITRIRFSILSVDGASLVGKKKLLVTGKGFSEGAKILIDGKEQKTTNDVQNPATLLIGKKAGKQITKGSMVTIQVKNPSGEVSNSISFTRT